MAAVGRSRMDPSRLRELLNVLRDAGVASAEVQDGPDRIAVTFAQARPTLDRDNGGKATTTATFAAPGDYILRLQANDSSGDGGGGFQCCWTNAHVAVSVKVK